LRPGILADAEVRVGLGGIEGEPEFTELNCVWLNAFECLKLQSQRPLLILAEWMLRLSVASQLLSPGLVMMFTPASPIVPTAGSEKHAGLKNRGAGTFDLGLQPDTTLMRAPSDADPVISSEGDVEKPGVNGPPVGEHRDAR